jgi:hypothetical protein
MRATLVFASGQPAKINSHKLRLVLFQPIFLTGLPGGFALRRRFDWDGKLRTTCTFLEALNHFLGQVLATANVYGLVQPATLDPSPSRAGYDAHAFPEAVQTDHHDVVVFHL